jgi:hypothetical protein
MNLHIKEKKGEKIENFKGELSTIVCCGSLVTNMAGDRKMANLFLQCTGYTCSGTKTPWIFCKYCVIISCTIFCSV